MNILLFSIIGFGLGALWGWRAAHRHVAAECERLGGVTVGNKIYKRDLIEEKDASE